MNDILLSFHDVVIRTPEQEVFPPVTLQIARGGQLALTGENEPFRNALFYALAGKTAIAHGTVSYPFYEQFLVDNPTDDPLFSPHKLIALVGPRHSFKNLSNTSQFYYQQRYNSLDAENAMTVEAYLAQVSAPVSNPAWTPERVKAELHLEPHLKKKVIQLSNGETKRVLIAAAILRNPVLLLLDNPLTGLDVEARKEIMELINHLASTGMTIVVNTSAEEIPSGIATVLLFEKDNSIRPVSSKLFRQEYQGNSVSADNISEAAVSGLLARRPFPAFEYIVNMKNVSVQYGDKRVLDGVNWSVRQGERWALLGHNGAGKTTLLSLLNGDNPQAYANDLVLFDRKRGTGESIWDIKSRIGFVSAELYQYFPVETSCLNAVESGFYDTTGLFRQSLPANREAALQWMKLLEIDSLSRKLLKNVSPVNQRLCLLARALVKCPPLLILDEPCQGLDRAHQLRFRFLLDLLCRFSNITLIYVTHYLEELPESVQNYLRLEQGKVVPPLKNKKYA